MEFQVGQKVRIKAGTTWLPVPPGTKLTITDFGLKGDVLYARSESGSLYWVNSEDVELAEEGNGEASDSVPNLTEGGRAG